MRGLGQQLTGGEGLRLLVDLHTELADPRYALPEEGLYVTYVTLHSHHGSRHHHMA